MRLKSLVLALALVTMALACSNCLSSSPPIQSDMLSAPTVSLTEQQKEKAISIAQNDPWVNDQINGVGEYSSASPFGNSERRVKDVVMSSFIDTSPGGNNTTYRMPAVIFIAGNESKDGADVHALVDLAKERVAFVGYTHRPGLANGWFNFSAYDRGVKASLDERGCLEFYNMTIRDTGYPYYNSTELIALHPIITNVTLEDPGVKSELDGHSYEVTGFGVFYREYPSGYMESYPTVSITVNDPKTGTPANGIMASVDPKTNKVINYLPYPIGEYPDISRLFPYSS